LARCLKIFNSGINVRLAEHTGTRSSLQLLNLAQPDLFLPSQELPWNMRLIAPVSPSWASEITSHAAGEAAFFEAAVELGGVEVDVREACMVERAAQEGLDLLIEPPCRCGLSQILICRWPRPMPPLGHRLCGWRCRRFGVGLHHHGVVGLVDPAARFEPVG